MTELWGEVASGDQMLLNRLAQFLEQLLHFSVGINFPSLPREECSERCLEYLMVGLRLKICTVQDVVGVVNSVRFNLAFKNSSLV